MGHVGRSSVSLKAVGIVASSYYVPDGKLTHNELAERFGNEIMGKIADASGILERRIAIASECASDLAYRAARDLMNQHRIDPQSIDLIIFATQTPDYLLPTTACILQHRLGIPTSAGAFDINLGCSQYVYALSVAYSMIAAGLKKRALVLTGDTISRILHPLDRSVVPLFGDAGTATLVEEVPANQGFAQFVLGSNGSGAEYLIWPTSGLRIPKTPKTACAITDNFGSTRKKDDMYMDGKAIFVFTLKMVPETVNELLTKSGLSVDDVDLFIFHQASEMIIETSAKKLKIPRKKLHYKLHDVGNSGGSTVCVALTDAWQLGKIKPGMKVVLTAFGVGLSWSATLINWPENTLGPVCTVDFSASPLRPGNQGL